MRFALITAFSLLGTGFAYAQSPVSTENVLHATTTIADQKIELPQGPVEVSATVITIQPGTSLPVHRHPFQRYGYVLAGTLSVRNQETGKTQSFKTGEFIIESLAKWHSGTNSGTEPLKLLVIDQAPSGAQITEVKKQ